MLRSVWTRESAGARRALGVALCLLIALRVLMQPLFATPPGEGLVPLCAGGELIWVDPDGIAPAGGETKKTPCPYTGLATAGLPPLGTALKIAMTSPVAAPWLDAGGAIAPDRRSRAHGARAPPSLSPGASA